MTIIAGVGTLIDPALGAGVLQLFGYWLSNTFGQSALLVIGVITILLVLFVPYGIVGAWHSTRSNGAACSIYCACEGLAIVTTLRVSADCLAARARSSDSAPLAGTAATDEAQMVYNFSLAPLTLHALQTGDAGRLSHWAATLKPPAPGAAFFNFIASHDGIGVLPAAGILGDAEVQGLVARTLAHGGRVSVKANPDGSTSAYELNITLYDFLNDPAAPDAHLDAPRFLASQAILPSTENTNRVTPGPHHDPPRRLLALVDAPSAPDFDEVLMVHAPAGCVVYCKRARIAPVSVGGKVKSIPACSIKYVQR